MRKIAAPCFSAPILQADVPSEQRAGTGARKKTLRKIVD
jgi:hypothetical protein